jgi:hypothetical protein
MSIKREYIILTESMIDAGRSTAGGWSLDQVNALGVGWPLKKGWKSQLIGSTVSDAAYEKFIALKSKKLPQPKKLKRLQGLRE